MSITTHEITQEEPVHFQVRGVGPNPFAQLSPSDELVLEIDYANKPGSIRFGIPKDWYLPYRDAIAEAMRSGAVYWVDWDCSKMPTFPPRPNDTTLDRLLNAVKNRQIVCSDSGDE